MMPKKPASAMPTISVIVSMDRAEDRVEVWLDCEAWLRYGFAHGWVSPPLCDTHDGVPLSAEEDAEFSAGHDPCVYVVRLYDDAAHKAACEAQSGPAVWRASERGWT